MSLVEIHDLCFVAHGREILHRINLTIEAGEIMTVVGPNGSGKTSLMRLIIGALKPNQGRVVRSPDLRIGYVPQKLHIEPSLPLSASQYVGLIEPSAQGAIDAALEDAGVTHAAHVPMNRLSGGQFQRVLLAAALLRNPNLLILDEATQGLDQAGAAAFYQKIDEIRRERKIAVLMVSHELHVVMSATDRVICLNNYICCQGTPEVVTSAPEYRALFGRGSKGALALYRHQDSQKPNDLDHHLHHDHS